MNQQDSVFEYSNNSTEYGSTFSANTNFISTDGKDQSEYIFDQPMHKPLIETSYQEDGHLFFANDLYPFEDLLNNYCIDMMHTNGNNFPNSYSDDFNICQSVVTSSTSSEMNIPSPSGTNWPSCPSSPTPDLENSFQFQSLIIPFASSQTPSICSNSSISSCELKPVLPSSLPSTIEKIKEPSDENAHHFHDSMMYVPVHPSHHQLNKPFSCYVCPRSFARKHDLQRHIRVHTGAKPYSCLNCSKAFARTDALKRHLRMEDSCRLSPVIQAMKDTGSRRYRNL